RLMRKKEHERDQKRPGGSASPLYKAVQKRLHKAEFGKPRQPRSSYYMSALRSAHKRSEKHPKDEMAAATADLLQTLYYYAKGDSVKELSKGNELYTREYYLANTSLTKDEFGLLVDTAVSVFNLEKEEKDESGTYSTIEVTVPMKTFSSRKDSISSEEDDQVSGETLVETLVTIEA
ncbi:MAG: hypothetical protein ABW153_13920, partial [Sedimenticola sp.]